MKEAPHAHDDNNVQSSLQPQKPQAGEDVRRNDEAAVPPDVIDQNAQMQAAEKQSKQVTPAPIDPLDRFRSKYDWGVSPVEEQLESIRKAWAKNNPPMAYGQWHGSRELGSGSFGVARLYYRVDDNGNVEERIVVKDAYFNGLDLTDYTAWAGSDLRDPDKRLHMEIKTMMDITARETGGPTKCVRYLAHSQDWQRFAYRLYMAYCPLGELAQCFRHRTPRQTLSMRLLDKIKPAEEPTVYNDGQDVPEPMIWKWLEDLTETCMLVGYGRVLTNEAQTDGEWKKIVHREIKPRNIFLDLPSDK